MSKMPETAWLEDEFGDGHEDQGSYGSWDCRNAYGYVHEYTRADTAAAQVAAAYERGVREAARHAASATGDVELMNSILALLDDPITDEQTG